MFSSLLKPIEEYLNCDHIAHSPFSFKRLSFSNADNLWYSRNWTPMHLIASEIIQEQNMKKWKIKKNKIVFFYVDTSRAWKKLKNSSNDLISTHNIFNPTLDTRRILLFTDTTETFINIPQLNWTKKTQSSGIYSMK